MGYVPSVPPWWAATADGHVPSPLLSDACEPNLCTHRAGEPHTLAIAQEPVRQADEHSVNEVVQTARQPTLEM